MAFKNIWEEQKALQWCCEVNHAGFSLISSKIERAQISSTSQSQQDLSKFKEAHFVREGTLLQGFEAVSKTLDKLSQSMSESHIDLTYFSLFLRTFYSRAYPASDISEATYLAIREDAASPLDMLLDEHQNTTQAKHAKLDSLLFTLLRCSILYDSRSCIESLLLRIRHLNSATVDSVINLQQLRASFILPYKLKCRKHSQACTEDFPDCVQCNSSCQDLVSFLLERFGPEELHTLITKDASGRLPLHDAVEYGLPNVCQMYLDYMQDPKHFPGSTAPNAILSRDSEGRTPLCLAVISGSYTVAKLLLEYGIDKEADHKENHKSNFQCVLDVLLPIAIKYDFAEIVELLLSHHANINAVGTYGETALYVAAQLGRQNYVRYIFDSVPLNSAAINRCETTRGWTPLISACVGGYLPIVECLLEAGADPEMYDLSGWTAQEHAAFRGHLQVAGLLAIRTGPVRPERSLPSSLRPVAREYSRNNENSHVSVVLGSPNTRDNVKAVVLSPQPPYSAHGSQQDFSGIVKIVVTDTSVCSGTSHTVQLPLLDDMTYHPCKFTVQDPSTVNLSFNVYYKTDGDLTQSSLIGSGIALLKTLRHGLAAHRESLARYYSIPILEKETLKFVGTITFGLVVITPFTQGKPVEPTATHGFWKDKGSTQVVGHRGLGANMDTCTNLQIGENTVQSFLSAATLGASCVEFDVQLTKDLVPVIFHDFLVMEAGGDTPLYTLSLKQFLHLSEAQLFRGDISALAEARYLAKTRDKIGYSNKPRSHSFGAYDESRSEDLAQRMKYTDSAMEGAYKGNLRGQSIQGIFPTFEDLFTKLPETISFNVEMKYPMLWEAEDRNMETYGPEINTYVNLVLDKIYHLGGKRSITFSSFSPEVCLALAIKQQDYPILFLSKSGSIPVGDVRCRSLQQSIQFAKRNGLAGIVMYSEPLILCPRLVQYAKSAGLICCSYGPMNNDPESAKVCFS